MFSLREKRDDLLFFLKLIFGLNIFSRLLFTNRFRSQVVRHQLDLLAERAVVIRSLCLANVGGVRVRGGHGAIHEHCRAEMFLQIPFECPGRIIVGRQRCVRDLVAAEAFGYVHDNVDLFTSTVVEPLAYLSADAGVMRHLDRIPACRGCRLCQERLGYSPTAPVVHHRKAGGVAGTSRRF